MVKDVDKYLDIYLLIVYNRRALVKDLENILDEEFSEILDGKDFESHRKSSQVFSSRNGNL